MRVAGANRRLLLLVLVVSLGLVLWGGWSLISGFPNFDAVHAVAAPLPTAEVQFPSEDAEPGESPTVLPVDTPTMLVPAPGASATAAAHAQETMLAQPSGSGGGAPTPKPLTPTSVAQNSPTAEQSDGAEPGAGTDPDSIRRSAEFAYPQRMQIDRPATVRLTIFAEGYETMNAQNSQVSRSDLNLPSQTGTDLVVRVVGDLEVEGAEITKEPANRVQELSDLANKWEWRITAAEPHHIQLRPVVQIEYVNATGRVEYRYEVPWKEIYYVTEVAGEGVAPVVGSWLGDNLVGLLGLIMGVPGTITTVVSLRKGDKAA